MAGWLSRLRQKTEMRPIPLRFESDRTDDGAWIVRVYDERDGGACLVRNPREMSGIGYVEPDDDDELIKHVIGRQDRFKLCSVLSQNPRIMPNGEMRLDVLPSILTYLRDQGRLDERPGSRNLTISREPLEPTVHIDHTPGQGLTVCTGYHTNGDDGGPLWPVDSLPKPTTDGYVKLGDCYRPVPTPAPKAQALLDQPVRYVSPADIPEFFMRDLVVIRSQFTAVLTDEAKRIRIVDQPAQPVVSYNRVSGGWLEFQLGMDVNGTNVPLETYRSQVRDGYYSPDGTTFVKDDPVQTEKMIREFENLGATPIEDGYALQVEKFATLDAFVANIGGIAQASEAYQAFLDQLTGFQDRDDYHLPDEMETLLESNGVFLRPYQRSGIHWLGWLMGHGLHGLLADDMGLGKTLQTLCALRLAYEREGSDAPSLVLAPKSVLVHWEREIRRCFPAAMPYRYHGPGRRMWKSAPGHPAIAISTYATVRNDVEKLGQIPFFALVLDEATRIKNHATSTAKAAMALNAAHRVALSGTPIENNLTELWSIFNFCMRGHLGSRAQFERRFGDPIEHGDQRARDALGERIAPFMRRRRKEDVAKDLPEKVEVDEWCELSDEQKDLYVRVQSQASDVLQDVEQGRYVSQTSILPILNHLKQICDHPAVFRPDNAPILGRSPKFDAIQAKICEIVASGQKVVVFSFFLDMLNLLEHSLADIAIPYIRIDGSTNNRQRLIDHFTDSACSVALCSLRATSHGINFTAANHVIHCDLWWNPAIMEQANDRVHRIGQDRTVYVHRFLVQDTLEERIVELLESKQGLADVVMDAAQERIGDWTREQLLAILKPLA